MEKGLMEASQKLFLSKKGLVEMVIDQPKNICQNRLSKTQKTRQSFITGLLRRNVSWFINSAKTKKPPERFSADGFLFFQNFIRVVNYWSIDKSAAAAPKSPTCSISIEASAIGASTSRFAVGAFATRRPSAKIFSPPAALTSS